MTNPGAGGTSMNESAYLAAERARDLARQNITATEQQAAHGLSGDSDARMESAEWASREAEARAGVPFFAATPVDTKAEWASVITVGVAVALSVAAIAYVLCTTSSKYRSTRLPDDGRAFGRV